MISLKDYLVKNNLITSEYELIESTNLSKNSIKLTAYSLDKWEAAIILCSLIKSVDHFDIPHMSFSLKKDGNLYWNIYYKYDSANSYLKAPNYNYRSLFHTVHKTVTMLLPYMASSNVSYLSLMMSCDDQPLDCWSKQNDVV